MNFLMEWILAWHRAVWFPFLWFSRLEAAPVEADFFNTKSEEEQVSTTHPGYECAGARPRARRD